MTGPLWASLLAATTPAFADDGDDQAIDPDDEIVVEADHPTDSPATRRLDRTGVEATPGRSADELLRAMPGLHVSRHGGRGKATQFFLRGFDAVHGSDLAIEVDGVPLNEPGNVHAHGYLDLYILPPSLVRGLTLSPGARNPEDGNFAIAGTARFDLGLTRHGVWLEGGGGTDRSVLGSVRAHAKDADPATFAVADADIGKGVGDARDWRLIRAAAGWGGDLGEAHARGWVLAYDGRFSSPGVVREDDVQDGTIHLLGAYPDSGGGRSTRVLSAFTLAGTDTDRAWRTTVYGGFRALSLTQNYTGFWEHPTQGDATTQSTTTVTGGARAWFGRALGQRARLRSGLDTRVDVLRQTDDNTLADGTVWQSGTELHATQGNVAGWASVPVEPITGIIAEPGLRADLFVVSPFGAPTAVAPVLAPSAAVTVGAHSPITGRAAYARGYRSPDVRGVGTDGQAVVATADTVEAGLHATPLVWLSMRAVGFLTTVSDEVVFDHVEARYLASGPTSRKGIDAGLTVAPVDHLRIEADATWSEGRFTETDTLIPYAPTQLYVLGVHTEAWTLGGVDLTGGIRGWHLAARPLPDGFASPPATVVDATAQVEGDRWQVSLDVDNLTGADWWDGTFVYPSHWNQAAQPSELPVRHITAGAARAARITVGWRL